MTALLSICDVSIHFHTTEGIITAVNGVNLNLHAGQSLAVVGESGAGKSQLFHAVMGLLPPNARTTGSVQIQGTELLHQPNRVWNRYRGKQMAMIFQDPMTALNPLLTIGRQLTEVLEVHQGLAAKTARYQAIAMLERVRIPDAARRYSSYPHELSGGMRQRVMIAMALLCEPALLIADEPTTALDVTVQTDIMLLLRDIQTTRGMSLVLITHDLALAGGLCDDVVVMQQGQVVETGAVESLFYQPQHPYTQQLLAAARH